MKILFITAHKYLPQMRGGLQNSTHQLCMELLSKNHQIAVLAGLMPGGLLAFAARIQMKMRSLFHGCKVARDTEVGYPVWRSWFAWESVAYVAEKEQPDLIVVLAMESVRMGLAAKATGVPVLMQLQDIEFHQHGGSFKDVSDLPCVANSNFTAEAYRRAFGVNPAVIQPFISAEKYQTETTRKNVTFINPVAEKGVDIALGVAQLCPEIPFTFVEGWPLTTEQRSALETKLATLPNVTLIPPQSDMRKIYSTCKILLAPSVWEEAYGRVATEAQFSGIPVIASNRGGLPEAVGPGGVLLSPQQPAASWAEAVRKLWEDDAYYKVLADAARAYAHRPAGSTASKLDKWEQVLTDASNQKRREKTP